MSSDSGCPGCFTSAKGQNAERERATNEARTYAKQNNVSVAIYKEGFEFKIMEVQQAIKNKYLIVDVVSCL